MAVDAVEKVALLTYFEKVVNDAAEEAKEDGLLGDSLLGQLEAIKTISEILGLREEFLKIVEKKLDEISVEYAPL